MLEDPGTEIFDVIRYFGTRKKIFNVHFRNIRGHRNDFVEVFPDEGDIDFVEAIKVYKEIGYPYMLMPDHVPLASNDPPAAVVCVLLRLYSRSDSIRRSNGVIQGARGVRIAGKMRLDRDPHPDRGPGGSNAFIGGLRTFTPEVVDDPLMHFRKRFQRMAGAAETLRIRCLRTGR